MRFQTWRLTHPRRNVRRKAIIKFAHDSGMAQKDIEIEEIIKYLGSSPLHHFSYRFLEKYSPSKYQAFSDPENGLHYVDHQGKRLYWQPERKKKRIPKDYAELRAEQDEQSPHRYLVPGFEVNSGDIIADIGCAEANFSLDVIEHAKHVYLFENDERWMKALHATFEPWKKKVTIVPSMVGEKNKNDMITLDTYFADKEPPTFLKLDVEGSEGAVLEGARGLITSNKNLKAAVCTYHNQDDEEILSSLLKEMGLEVSCSHGYMLMYRMDQFDPPYFRRGLIRATKSV